MNESPACSEEPRNDEAVTVIVRTRIRPECEREFMEWQAGIASAAHGFPGHLGIHMLRPSDPRHGEYVAIFRFRTFTELDAWERSDVRREWIEKVEPLRQAAPVIEKAYGLDSWFVLPSAAVALPPRWKMVIVTAVALYPIVNGLAYLWRPLFSGVSPWLSGLITVPSTMLLMTYFLMPKMTRLFARWLYADGTVKTSRERSA